MRSARGSLRRLTGAQVLLIVSAFAALLLSLTVSVPLLRAEMATANVVDQQARQVDQQVDDAARVRTDRKAAAALEDLHAAIPTGANLDSALVLLQDAVRGSGASWLGSSSASAPDSSVTVDGQRRVVRVYTVSVRMKGAPGQVADFLGRVEKLPRLSAIDSVIVTPTETTVSLRMYSLAAQR